MSERKLRGLAALKETNPERLKEIAGMGGKAAHSQGRARQWNVESAREAGRLGGLALQKKKREAKLLDAKVNEGFEMSEEIKAVS